MSSTQTLSPGMKMLVEIGPLGAFFVANAYAGIFWATGIFMVVTIIALAFSWLKTGTIALVPMIGAGFVALFGLLTLWLQDDIFIKVKVTLVNALFGSVLLVGFFRNKPLLSHVLGETVKMDPVGWQKLTLRWAMFFFAVAVLNEFVWRNFDTSAWVNFKVFGLLPLTFLFAICQLPLMQRHGLAEPGPNP